LQIGFMLFYVIQWHSSLTSTLAMKIRRYFILAETIMALVAICWTSVILLETSRGTSLYPQIRQLLKAVGGYSHYMIHDTRILTYENISTGQKIITKMSATGLIVINRHPSLGSRIYRDDGEYQLMSIERRGPPLNINVLLVSLFVFVIGLGAWQRKTIWGVFSLARQWFTRVLLYMFMLWGFTGTLNLLLRGAEHIAMTVNQVTFYSIMAGVCILSWILTYAFRFMNR